MTRYRAAVVGLSNIASLKPQPASDPVLGSLTPHSHVSAYADVPRATVVAVCDLKPALIDRFRTDWGATFPEARAYGDYREMLRAERIELLSVATPDHLHAQIVIDACEAGVKGIFCEKPIATTLADADRMIAACAASGVALLVNHTRRWRPNFLQARRLIRSGAIGRVTRVATTMAGPRAMLFRNGTHRIDTVNFLIEAEPEWVIAALDDEHASHPPRYAGDGGRDPDSDPGATAIVGYRGGIRALINLAKKGAQVNDWDVIGDRGRLRLSSDGVELWQRLDDGEIVQRPLAVEMTTKTDMTAAVEELIGLVENGGTGSSTGEDARRTLSILLGIVQSNARGHARVDFPIQDA